MELSREQLEFIVRFIGDCRNAEGDSALERLVDELQAEIDFGSLWVGSCAPSGMTTIAAIGGPMAVAVQNCVPVRRPRLDSTEAGVRACLDATDGNSACMVLSGELSAVSRAIVESVLPHLLDAVSRISPLPRGRAMPVLTIREKEILRWLVQGKSNEVIATILGISSRTVKFHLGNLYSKLGVTTRAQAAAVAVALLIS